MSAVADQLAGAPQLGAITGCRACGAPDLVPVLALGRTPLANSLLTPDQLAGEGEGAPPGPEGPVG